MNYQCELEFFRKFLRNIHLKEQIITKDSETPFDLGLRSLLSIEQEYSDARDFFESKSLPNTIYKVTDTLFCHYIFLLLPDLDQPEAMLIGPYTTVNISEQTIMNFMEARRVPAQLLFPMIEYYGQIPILWEDEPLFAALEVLAEAMWGSRDRYDIQTLDYLHPDIFTSLSSHYSSLYHESYNMERLELRYQKENQLLRAVSQGQFQKAEELLSPFSWQIIEQRTPDSIRNMKNYLVILNTLMRKAAEQGDVHPLHIDRLSDYFARKIELLTHQSDMAKLAREMAHKYCLLVKNHSLRSYSLPVQKVITYVDYDLTADLSLKAQAQQLNVNPSYLSTLFKRETGITLTDYVNQKRIEHAIFLLNSTSLQVQTIAQQCGFPDVNYFSKLFKKLVGKTPVEYRRNITQAL